MLASFLKKHGLVVLSHILMMVLLSLAHPYKWGMILFSLSTILPIYINHFILIPRYFTYKKVGYYFVYALLVFAIYFTTIYLFIGDGVAIKYSMEGSSLAAGKLELLKLRVAFSFAVLLGIIGLITTLVQFALQSMSIAELKEQMVLVEKEKVVAELDALKTQINPHFFFNALNSIYSLSLDRSEKVSTYIVTLSDLMRYVLYDSNQERVSLDKEISFIRDYVDLQRIRLPNEAVVTLDVEANSTSEEHLVAPLLLLPLVENCFKHGGFSSNVESFISIALQCKDGWLRFRTANSVSPIRQKVKGKEGGVGLRNVQKRLDLIYPHRYKFKYFEQDNQFVVEVEISIV